MEQTSKHRTAGEESVNLRRSDDGTVGSLLSRRPEMSAADRKALEELLFHRMIAIERKRSERSGKPFLLMLVGTGDSLPSKKSEKVLANMARGLSLSTRETDVTGWYKDKSVLGTMFSGIVAGDGSRHVAAIFARLGRTLCDNLTAEQFNQISISFHLYPEDWEHELFRRPSNPTLYPDLARRDESRKFLTIIKRIIDIFGSAFALIVFAPLFVAIAAAIKLTSKGPIFFRQERVGQHGRPFVFVKFRSMHINNDSAIHKQWFSKFVSGHAEWHPTNNGNGSFKLIRDSRVTRVGKFLRRTSLDELPQFINVLKGEMSLVGPRQPIPYEVDAYQTWHRRRILEAKPGITGLWQVNGRSRVTFDEMVRLDLRYARSWSLWLDLKILAQTPWAVLLGDGAY